MKPKLFKISKTYTEDDIRDLQGELLEEEIETNKSIRKERPEYINYPITLNGDTGRDDTPQPYFHWTIQGNEPKKMLQINEVLLNGLKKHKRKHP
jgi:hypothetical protein